MPVEKHPIASRDHWLAMRRDDLTASDVAAALGLSPWKTQLALYAEKTGLIDPPPAGPIARRGLWLESAVLAAINDEHPEWLNLCKQTHYFRDPEIKLGATPDAHAWIDSQPVNVQLKVVAKPEHDRHWADGVPLHYQLQALTEAMLTGTAYSMVAALVVSTYSAELFTYRVDRHPSAEQRIHDTALGFWTNVANGVRPAATAPSDVQILQQLFPESVPEPVLDLSGDNRLPELLATRADLKAQVKQAQAALEGIDTEIKDRMEHSEKAVLPGWRISWPTTHVAEKIIAAHSYRRLTVTKLKDDQP